MDRLGVISAAESIRIAESFFVGRPNNFYGWAVITAQHVRDFGCTVTLAGVEGNTEHCNVEIPIDLWIDDDRLTNLRVALADEATVLQI